MKNVVKKYLATYAEPEALVGAQLDRTTHRALVIPALGEDISMLERVAPAIDRVASRSERVLLVIVVNANERHEGDVLDLNDQLLHALDKRYRLRTLSKPGRPPVRYGHEEHHDVIVINRHAAEHRFHK